MFSGFNQDAINFLKDLKQNNTKIWFEQNRPRYEKAILNPNIGMHWNKTTKRIRPEGNFAQCGVAQCGKFVIYEARIVNENLDFNCTNPDGLGSSFYDNDWLLSYTTALIKKQAGTNTKKFQNIQVANGFEFNEPRFLKSGSMFSFSRKLKIGC